MNIKSKTELDNMLKELRDIIKELDDISNDIKKNTIYHICADEINRISIKLRALKQTINKIYH